MAIPLCRHKSQLTGRFNGLLIEAVAEAARATLMSDTVPSAFSNTETLIEPST